MLPKSINNIEVYESVDLFVPNSMVLLLKQIKVIILGTVLCCGIRECRNKINKIGVKESVFQENVSKEVSGLNPIKKPYSNPVLIYGTSFGNFFQVLFRTGDYNTMLAFTSSESIDKFGKDTIIDFYKNRFQFGFELGKLKSMTTENEIYTLNYPDAIISATRTTIRIKVRIENDSTKIVLSNLNNPIKN